MGRGRFYTAKEDRQLINLHNDFPDENFREIARKAHNYGIAEDKAIVALARHINNLVNPRPEPKPAEPEIPAAPVQTEITVEDLIKLNETDCNDKYEELMNTILMSATLNDYGTGLWIDFKTIRTWLWENEKDRMMGRVEELRREKYIY